MVMSDAMSQVAQALNSTTSSQVAKNKPQEGVSAVLRNRRRAIVPPKLATDGSISDSENKDGDAKVGQLVDVDDSNDDSNNEIDGKDYRGDQDRARLNLEDEANLRAFRRKRSGGGTEKTVLQQQEEKASRKSSSQPEKRLFGSQNALPTFHIEPSDLPTSEGLSPSVRWTPDAGASGYDNNTTRPESQMTNVDSIVSSGSSTNLSLR